MEEYFSLVNEKEKQFTANLICQLQIPFTLEVERHIPGIHFVPFLCQHSYNWWAKKRLEKGAKYQLISKDLDTELLLHHI